METFVTRKSKTLITMKSTLYKILSPHNGSIMVLEDFELPDYILQLDKKKKKKDLYAFEENRLLNKNLC